MVKRPTPGQIVQGPPGSGQITGPGTPAAPSAKGPPPMSAMQPPVQPMPGIPAAELKPEPIPPHIVQKTSKPMGRAELVNTLLANPRTASQLKAVSNFRGIPPQKLMTMSVMGKPAMLQPHKAPSMTSAIGSSMSGADPSSVMLNLDWESGVQFTPNQHLGKLHIHCAQLPRWSTLKEAHENDRIELKRSQILLYSVEGMKPGTYMIALNV